MNTDIDNVPKKRSYWGYGVVITYSVFVLGTLSVVYFSFTQKVDLVTQDYYAKSLVHDKQMEIARNGETQKVMVELNQNKSTINIQFPVSDVKGTVFLYRPSGSDMDKDFPINLDTGNNMYIQTAELAKGYWKVKVQWNHAGTGYFNEYKIEL